MPREKIDQQISKNMDQILKESGDLFQKGDLRESLKVAQKAWDLIPDPKNKWDYYPQTLSSGFVEDYTELRDVDAARKWIGVTYEMYDDPSHSSHYVLMLEGSSLYKLDLKDEAYDVFEKIYELFGREGFKGEQLQYLEFYLKERAKRG